MTESDTTRVDLRRRRLLAAGLALPAGAAGLGGAAAIGYAAAPASPVASGLPVRRSIGALAPDSDEVRLYREGLGILRARSERNPADPTGFGQLAVQHALFCSSATPDLQVHWGWDFLTWHRAFLWIYERHLRAALGEPRFALPYWDATRHRRIPAAYWGEGNPLNDSTRLQGPDDELPDDLLNARQALAVDDFHAFGGYPYPNPTGEMVEGNLEQGFHNNVHNWIGGNMASFALAGFEPLFPAHHNNVDRLWAAWVARRGTDALPTDPAWLSRRYQFVNEHAKLESVQVRDLLDPRALGYQFDDFEFGARREPDPVLDESAGGIRVPVEGMVLSGNGRAKVLRFERNAVPVHPYCARVFLRGEGLEATYVGTFTILPVQQGGRAALDAGVTMQLALPDALVERLGTVAGVEAVLAPVPLKGRAIPTALVRPGRVVISDVL